MKACGDYACIDACVARATDTGQGLFNALGDCGAQSNCGDFYCTIDACPQQWDACQTDFGEDGYFCFASGNYYVCDNDGNCPVKVADGGWWGATQDEAAVAGLANCTDHMANKILIEGASAAEAGVTNSCVVTSCGPQ